MRRTAQCLWRLLLSPRTHLAASIALIAYNVLGMRLLYARNNIDYWAHLATMSAFAREPLNPGNPYIPTVRPGYLLAPSQLLWGLIAGALRTHPFWLLPAVAGANMLLFALGAQAFARRIIGDRRYALALMLTMLFFWVRPWGWSAVSSFGILPLTSVYRYWLALPLSLLIMAAYGESQGALPLIGQALAVGCVFLVHPLTGSFLILCLAAKVLTARGSSTGRRLLLLALPTVSMVLSALAWPYYPVFGIILSFGGFQEGGMGENWRFFYDGALLRILPALLGLPFLARELLKRRFSFAALGLVAAGSVYALNYLVLHHPTLGRYIVYVAFFGQLGVVLTLRRMEHHRLSHAAIIGYVVVLLTVAAPQLVNSVKFVGPLRDVAFGQLIGAHSNVSLFRQYASLRHYLGSEDVVMAPLEISHELPAMVGCRIVGTRHHNPYMGNHLERKAATERFYLSDVTAAERLDILSLYSASHVLVPRAHEAAVAGFVPQLELQYRDPGYALYASQ